MLQLRDQWLSLGGTASPLGSPVKPPAWASSIAPANTLEQQPTTGDHDGQVLFFQNGLIYWRDGLVGQNGSSAPLVMVYDMPAMGFDTSGAVHLGAVPAATAGPVRRRKRSRYRQLQPG